MYRPIPNLTLDHHTDQDGDPLLLRDDDGNVLNLTEHANRVALEIDLENGVTWLSFQAAVHVGNLELPFPIETVKGYLGGAAGMIDKDHDELVELFEAAAVQAQGFGSSPTAVGEAIVRVLQDLGVVAGGPVSADPGPEVSGYAH